MPFVVSRVSAPLSREQETELKRRMGRAIAHVPGKSEGGLVDYDTLVRAIGARA